MVRIIKFRAKNGIKLTTLNIKTLSQPELHILKVASFSFILKKRPYVLFLKKNRQSN